MNKRFVTCIASAYEVIELLIFGKRVLLRLSLNNVDGGSGEFVPHWGGDLLEVAPFEGNICLKVDHS